ncbi:hypothetical protein ACP70R_020033 [Stipagrostis hirtigluma subsp. patula]
MRNQRQPSCSGFHPRSRMSRLKVADGLSQRKCEGVFRSKRMKKIAKEVKKLKDHMAFANRNKSNRSIVVTNKVPMQSGEKVGECSVKDQRSNMVSAQARKNPSKGINREQLNALRLNKSPVSVENSASKSKHSIAHISKDACHLPTSRSASGFKDIKSSMSSRTMDVLSLEKQENHTLSTENGLSMTLGHPKHSRLSKVKEAIVHQSNATGRSHPTHLRVVAKLSHKASDVDTLNPIDDALAARLKDRSNPNKGEDINAKRYINEILRSLKGREVSKGSSYPVASEILVPEKIDSNEDKGRHGEVMILKEYETEGQTSEDHEDTVKTNGARKLLNDNQHEQGLEKKSGNNSSAFGKNVKKDFSRHYTRRRKNKALLMKDDSFALSSKDIAQSEFKESNLKLYQTDQPNGSYGKIDDGKSKRRKEPMSKENPDIDASDSVIVVRQENPTCRPIKRRYIPTHEDDEVDSTEDGAISLIPQVAISKDYVVQQKYCCSRPIDVPAWRGIFKIDGKEYVSLAAHLSTQSCDKVWNLTRSLFPIVEVAKVSRSANWPKIWKGSKPNGDTIGMYFLPHKMRHDEEQRHDEELDKLVKEVVENDLVLRAVMSEAEMLIFPSIILPERYQTFQAKHYLWGVFKPNGDKFAAFAEFAQEEEKETQHSSNQQNEVQCEESDREIILMKTVLPLKNQQLPTSCAQQAEACSVDGSIMMGLEAPKEGKLGDASCHATVATAIATTTATVPADANADASDAASASAEAISISNSASTLLANQERINSSMGDTPGSMFSIVVRQTPNIEKKLDQFIQDMKQDGALVVVTKGETIGVGPWSTNIVTTNQPCSSRGGAHSK